MPSDDEQAEPPRRTERVTVKLTPGEKEKWSRWADENPNASSLSDHVRLAVSQKQHGKLDRDAVDGLDISIGEDDIDQLEESVRTLGEQVADIPDQVAEQMQEQRFDDVEVDDLARDIYHHLPVHDSGDEFVPLESHHIADAEERLEKAQMASSPSGWARWFDVPVSKVRSACAKMLEFYPDAEFVHEDWKYGKAPERRYFKTAEHGAPGADDE